MYRPIFSRLVFDEDAVARIRAAAARGPLVYVLPAVSYMAWIYLRYAIARHGLPAVAQTNARLQTILLWPAHVVASWLGMLRRFLTGRVKEPRERAVRRAARAGRGTLLFLRPARPDGAHPRDVRKIRGQFIEALVGLCRQDAVQVQLVPLTLVLGHPTVRRKAHDGPSLGDLLFGEAESPGRFRAFVQFLWHARDSMVKVAAPIDLAAFIAEHDELSAEVLARKVRFELTGAIERERRVLMGPAVKSPRRIRLDVLRSRRLVELVDTLAAGAGPGARPALVKRAEKLVREIAAAPRRWALGFSKWIMSILLERMYEGVDIDAAGMARVRDAARRGPLLLLPSHKSHIDYLILSYIFYLHDLAPPHIAAGKNLAFFPIGGLFRRCGAFFLRRSFKGDALYAAVFETYVRRLLRDHHSVEFFIEGGRSRTGKVLAPKYGLLGICADAVLDGDAPDTQVVPLAISYEKIVEEKSYERELGGGKKEKEGLGSLLKAGRVLGARYGRIEVQFGEPFAMRAALGEVDGTDGRKRAVQRLAHRVTWEIAQAGAIMPSALIAAAALATTARALPRGELVRRIHLLRQLAAKRGARFSASLVRDHDQAISDNLERMCNDGNGDLDQQGTGADRLIKVPAERRLRLEYYKNTAIHALADVALAARAAWIAGPGARLAAVQDRALELSRLLKRELVFRPGLGFERAFATAIDDLTTAGAVVPTGAELGWGVAAADLELLGGLVGSYVESYHLAFTVLGERAPEPRREAVARMLSRGERALLLGTMSRPEALSRPILETAYDALLEADRATVQAQLAAAR
jgi:glycerol-3-phosphate O-acyltransferase